MGRGAKPSPIEAAKEHLTGGEVVETTTNDNKSEDGAIEANAGAHEAAHEAALETLESIAEDLSIGGQALKQLVAIMRDGMLEVFKHRQRPWGQLSAGEQKDVAATLEHCAKSMVRKAVIAIASEDRPSVRAKLEGYGEKDGVKINLSLGSMPPEEMGQAILLLHGAVKREVLIITADAEAYAGPKKAEIMPDDPELSFPEDNSDLAGEDQDEDAAKVGEVDIQGDDEEQQPTEHNGGEFGVFDPAEAEWLSKDAETWTDDTSEAGTWSEAHAQTLASGFEGEFSVRKISDD